MLVGIPLKIIRKSTAPWLPRLEICVEQPGKHFEHLRCLFMNYDSEITLSQILPLFYRAPCRSVHNSVLRNFVPINIEINLLMSEYIKIELIFERLDSKFTSRFVPYISVSHRIIA